MNKILLLLLLFPTLAIAQEMSDTIMPAPYDAAAVIVPDDPFTITNVVVDVTADNAVDARAQAFEKGSALAVEQFIAAQGADIDIASINADKLVRDFRVDEEHFSRTRYKARLTYRFKPSAMASLVNPVLPEAQTLNVPTEEEVGADEIDPDAPFTGLQTPTNGTAPVSTDYDQPWTPKTEQAVTPTPAPQTQNTLSTWRLSVRYDQVGQWLQAQELIQARPEMRGYRIISTSGDQAVIEVTTDGDINSVQQKWNAIGWGTNAQNGGLAINAVQIIR